MLSATLVETRTVTLDGIKPQWRITKGDDVVTVKDEAYIRVATCNFGLSSIVAADNDECPTPSPKYLLSASKGLAELIYMRNRKQAESLSNVPEGCDLFEQVRKRPRWTNSRHQQETLRQSPDTIAIELDIDGVMHEVDVLRPVHPTDNLFIAYKADMIAATLHYLRTRGFNEAHSKAAQCNLPKGIHRHKHGYVVKFMKLSGAAGYKLCKESLDEAIAFKSQVDEEAAHAAEDVEGEDAD
jgi:hypothetical protein